MILRNITGEPLRVYKGIALKYGLYDKILDKFVYGLQGETRKKPDFKYNDPGIIEILNEAKDYYNDNSTSGVKIMNINTFKDCFEMQLSSDYPLEGPSRTLAIFGKHLSENDRFEPLISGSSILRYNDITQERREKALSEFQKHQNEISDYDFVQFFLSRLMIGGEISTSEDRKFIERAKKELYQYMLAPLEYIYNR